MAEKNSSLLGSSLSGVAWLGGSQVVGQVINLGFKVILARMLSPTEFGVVAVAVAFISFSRLFVQLGFGDAIVQRRAAEFGERERATAFWANLLVGVLACPLAILAAPWLAVAFDAPAVEPVIQVLSLSFIVLAPQSMLRALFQRTMNFRILGGASVLGAVAGGVAGIVLALLGWGVWALVAMNMVRSATVTLAVFLAARWVPRQFIHLGTLRSLWSFGMYMTGVRVLNGFMRNIDTVLVGLYLGQNAVGLYSMAYQGVVMPLQYVSRPIGSVVYSALCRMEDDRARRSDAFGKTFEVLVVVGWPMGILGGSTAHIVLPAVLGPHWAEVAPIFAVLAVSGAIQTMLQTSTSLVIASGRPGIALGIQICRAIFVTVGVAVGLAWGPFGVAVGYAVAWVVLIPVHLAPVSMFGGVPARLILSVFGRGLAMLALSGLVGATVYLSGIGPEPVRTLVAAGLAVVAWVLLGLTWMASFKAIGALLSRRVMKLVRRGRS